MSERSVALLRGINVGGKNRLAMKDLQQIFLDLGCSKVTTYIQSGNVVFETGTASLTTLANATRSAIESRHGLRVPVIVRTASAWRAVIAANPYQDLERLHVVFLEAPPANADALDPDRSPGDTFHVSGAEIYLHTPNGLADTKLTNAYFDSKLKTISTVRNWRTVLEIEKLL